jgi:hypothetical protein
MPVFPVPVAVPAVVPPVPPLVVFLVINHTEYSSDDVIAGFTDYRDAINYANSEPLYTDVRYINKLSVNRPDIYPEFTNYGRKRR